MNDPDHFLRRGFPPREALPVDIVREIANDVIRTDSRGVEALHTAASLGSCPSTAVSSELLTPRGVPANPSNILITRAALRALTFSARSLSIPATSSLSNLPPSFHCVEIFEMFQARCISVAMDEDGMIPEDLEEKIRRHSPKMIYLVPSFHNPRGGPCPLKEKNYLPG
jgi:2-aminoadipate transaminase